MVLGIISAMTEELELLLKDMDIKEETKKANMTFYRGSLENKDIIHLI